MPEARKQHQIKPEKSMIVLPSSALTYIKFHSLRLSYSQLAEKTSSDVLVESDALVTGRYSLRCASFLYRCAFYVTLDVIPQR